MKFGLIIVGDEILSGKRTDKHFAKVLELLQTRGLALSSVQYVGDDPERLTNVLQAAFASGEVVFCCGGIGATPDDHTRQSAARALGAELALHPQAAALLRERLMELAQQQGEPYEPERADNLQRLQMAMFPVGARIIPNPYNKIAGFSVGEVHFVPGFPVMAWPMLEWVLETRYARLFHRAPSAEHSVIVYEGLEATLTPLMQRIERQHPQVKVFSLPSVDHPVHGRHIELGVKGPTAAVEPAWQALQQALHQCGARLGPELVRSL